MLSSVLRLVLVHVLLNEVYAHNTRDIEVILLPIWNSNKGASEIPLTFEVFGQLIQLSLRRNDKIVSPEFQIWKHNTKGIIEELLQLNAPESCYYLHEDDIASAAISFCQEHGLHGLIFLENVTLEITPLRNSLKSSPLLVDDRYINKKEAVSIGEPHVVKRSLSLRVPSLQETHPKRARLAKDERLTLELAVFFDEAAYRLFSPFLDEDDEKIRDMLLAYVNGVQALYRHPSLGVPIDISLIRLDVIQRQPFDLPHFGGERGGLLDSFCHYASARNPAEDDDPRHWDMALYVTGLDLYALEDGKRNRATMGLATVGGLCIPLYSCVIAELGVTDQLGKPYPSAGFTSVFIAAHEIGHNLLGIRNGFIFGEADSFKKFFFLPGTHCAPGRECRGGECMPVLEQSSNSEKGSWSEWKEDSCSSGCLERSKGVRVRRRFCENRDHKPVTSCKGSYYNVLLCNDEKLCRKKRRTTVIEFATLKCRLFSEKLPELDGSAKGLQVDHEADLPWIACAIFCRRRDIAAYYAPRVELNDLGLDPYLPDGTWCYAEGGRDYFCRQHHCLPEHFVFGKKARPRMDYYHRYEEELGPQNAGNQLGLIDRLVKYLKTPGPNGLPLLTSVSRGTPPPSEDEWIDKDYIELPAFEAGFSMTS
ncbi:A disintegrin and metalloproteinase with thrombospondin motifs adt-2-like [Nylanderia fulva]|uniref:A disintegrin and metalloproteinase with thrombospondin motifs adt-2-like n=1 Tax=Nylanderia fulva TaxID=613905 RepID=UPI0010FAFBC6|nr:A disintegrin and metalloproteinase with thrombospondin motifs adt-2-like [Nylanderia fulva]